MKFLQLGVAVVVAMMVLCHDMRIIASRVVIWQWGKQTMMIQIKALPGPHAATTLPQAQVQSALG